MYLSRCNMGMLSWWRAVESKGLAMKSAMVPASCTTLQPFNPLWSMLYPKADTIPQACRLDSGGPLLTGIHRTLLPPLAESYQPCPLHQIWVSCFLQSHHHHRLPSPHSPINDAARKAQFHPV